MRYSKCSIVDAEVSRLVACGWQIVPGRKHTKVKSPGGHTIPFAKTPSDVRTSRNFVAQVRRTERAEASGATQ